MINFFSFYRTISKSLSHNMNQKKDSTYINSSTPRRSSPLNDSTSSINNQPIGLVEGSLEYRELKRMYLREKNDAEEWRKDYQIMKRQLAQLKSSTIRKFQFTLLIRENPETQTIILII